MEKKNLISVIVCTYNQADTIGRTLDSILRQECHVPIEILVGEDCSTDRTLKVCQQYAEKYPEVVRLFANRANKGIVDNYFDCLLAARGRYIADCAGDDEWNDPKKLEKEVTLLEEHPDVTLVHTDYLNRDSDTGNIYPPRPHSCYHIAKGETEVMDGQELVVPILTQLARPVIHLCTAMYRSEVILKAYDHYPEVFRNKDYGCEDVQVCLLLAMAGKVAYINEPTLYYSTGRRTISCTHNEEKQFRFVMHATQLDYDLSQTFHIEDERLRRYFEYRIYALLMHAFRCHNKALRTEALMSTKTWGVGLNRQARVVKYVTGSPLLWSLALFVRKLLVR